MKGLPSVVVAILSLAADLVLAARVPKDSQNQIVSTPKAEGNSKEWSWNDVTAGNRLAWQRCYGGEYECSRLVLPMDWSQPDGPKNVTLAVIKFPAGRRGSPDTNTNLPPLFFNPGGPGASGVEALRSWGATLRKAVGDNMDIISWDPRGVGVSSPRVNCWRNLVQQELWEGVSRLAEDRYVGTEYVVQQGFNKMCEDAMAQTGLLEHMGTMNHARDLKALMDQTGSEKLRYWGVSYGTILGGAFAALFPESVDRLISDGNMDYQSWKDMDFSTWFTDLDAVLDAFDSSCHQAGDKCAFSASSQEAVKTRRVALFDKLKDSPVLIKPGPGPESPDWPMMATYSALMDLTLSYIQSPYQSFPGLAKMYAQLESNNGALYYEAYRTGNLGKRMLKLGEACAGTDSSPADILEESINMDAHRAILCADTGRGAETVEQAREGFVSMRNVSEWANRFFYGYRLSCASWPAVSSPPFTIADMEIDTAHPILFIGNKADPTTPLQNAKRNSLHFSKSVVVTQNSYGHSSLIADSPCLRDIIKAYMQQGTLPPQGKICDTTSKLFGSVVLP